MFAATVAVGETLLCRFQWDMSGINVHATTDIGHHTSTLVRTMTTIASDLEGQGKYKGRSRSSSNISSPKNQSTKFFRKTNSSSKVSHAHRRSLSMHRPSQADANYTSALEQELAKQTKKVQHLRYTGASGESLRTEEAHLRSTEQELARTVQRIFRHPRTGLTLQRVNQLFNPWPVGMQERASSVRRRLSTAVRTRLFSLSEGKEDEVAKSVSLTPVHTKSKSGEGMKKYGHRRYRSDLTGMIGSSPTTPALSEANSQEGEQQQEEGDDDLFQPPEETADKEGTLSVSEAKDQEGFALPSIDLEFDITVTVDHGKIVLRTEDR